MRVDGHGRLREALRLVHVHHRLGRGRALWRAEEDLTRALADVAGRHLAEVGRAAARGVAAYGRALHLGQAGGEAVELRIERLRERHIGGLARRRRPG